MTKYPLQAVVLSPRGFMGDSMYPLRTGRIYAARRAGRSLLNLELRDVEDAQGDPAWVPSNVFWVLDLKGPAAVHGAFDEL